MRYVLLFLCACASGSHGYAMNVVVTLKPLHSLVQNILGDRIQAELLLDSSASPHDVQLKPSTIRKINKADVIILIDRSFEGFMQNMIKSRHGDAVIVELIHSPGIKQLTPRHHAHGNENHTGQDDVDPHIWLNPDNAKSIVRLLADKFSELDVENSHQYQQNLAITLDKLNQLDVTLKNQLDSLKETAFIAQHDAYQYFDRHYNLKFINAITLDASIPPSVKLALNMNKRIKDKKVKCIFHEPQYSDRLVKTLADNAGINSGILDPIGVDLQPGPDLYFDVMKNLAYNFAKCLTHTA